MTPFLGSVRTGGYRFLEWTGLAGNPEHFVGDERIVQRANA